MDGIINFYKPLGLTSAKALDGVRRIIGPCKSGHAGALDPLADGVLVLCLGRATKLVEALMDQPKLYRAVAALDITSPSFDAEQVATSVPVECPPDLERLLEVLRSFVGTSAQLPPATSALKVRGQPAYKLSRAGRPPALEPRPIRIYWTHLHEYSWPRLDFELACGRGTYVRALIRDIGLRLGTGGCLTALTRRAVGPFRIEESWSLEALAANADVAKAVVPLEAARTMLAERPVRIPGGPMTE